MPFAAAQRLERLAVALAGGGGMLDDSDARQIAASLQAYLSGTAESLDHAFGLRPAAGQRSWQTRHAMQVRDDALREAARTFLAGTNISEQSKALSTALSRYATSAWLREGGANECPARHEGRLEFFLWTILRADPRPLSHERIRKVLVTSSNCS
jgi:hypothetical protein